MSNSSNISITEPTSPLQETDNSAGSLTSPIYGLIENYTSSSGGETPGARSLSNSTSSTFDLTSGDGQNGLSNTTTFDVNGDFAGIRRFCNNVSNNLNSIGLAISSPISANNSRRAPQFITDSPLELIDLCNESAESSPQRSARNLVPDAFVDLCTPNSPGTEYRADNLNSLYRIVPARRRILRSSMPNINNSNSITNNQAAELPPPPKMQKMNKAKNKDKDKDKEIKENSIKEHPYKCPVCLENVRKRQPFSTKCGHIFCQTCIETAIKATHKCPLCNLKLTIKSIFRIYL